MVYPTQLRGAPRSRVLKRCDALKTSNVALKKAQRLHNATVQGGSASLRVCADAACGAALNAAEAHARTKVAAAKAADEAALYYERRAQVAASAAHSSRTVRMSAEAAGAATAAAAAAKLLADHHRATANEYAAEVRAKLHGCSMSLATSTRVRGGPPSTRVRGPPGFTATCITGRRMPLMLQYAGEDCAARCGSADQQQQRP